MADLSDNWIETKAEGPSQLSWKVVRVGQVIHSGVLEGVDPSGLQGYRAALEWAEAHCPGVSFHWRHQTYAQTIRRESAPSPSGDESDRKRDGDMKK